jgi:Glycine-zipper domain
MRASPVIALAASLALGACAVAPPTGPTFAAMPPKGKNLAEFQREDVACRQYAAQQLGIAPAEAAQQSAINSAAVGTLLGAAAGAAIGAAAGNPAIGAAAGAGGGLLLGSAAGANAAAASGASFQQRYNVDYAQCMASKGNTVPTMASAPPVYAPVPYAAAPGYGYAYAYPAPYYPYPYYPYPGYYGPAYIGFRGGWGWHRWH